MDSNELIEEIETAFADVPYPGDENITKCSYDKANGGEFDGPCSECIDIAEHFKGKQWSSMTAEYLRAEPASLGLFTVDAFVYFLPAYLMRSLDDAEELDVLCDYLLWVLSPHGQTPYARKHLDEVLTRLTPRQRQVIRRYFEYLATSCDDLDRPYVEAALELH